MWGKFQHQLHKKSKLNKEQIILKSKSKSVRVEEVDLKNIELKFIHM